eukprot:gene32774-39623_t
MNSILFLILCPTLLISAFRYSRLSLRSSILRTTNVEEQDSPKELSWQGIDYQLSQSLLEKRAKRKLGRPLLERGAETGNSVDSAVTDAEETEGKELIEPTNHTLPPNLPNNLNPELAQVLVSDPLVLQLLRDPRMIEMMQAMTQGGQDSLKKYLGNPDALMLLDQLNAAISKAMKNKAQP